LVTELLEAVRLILPSPPAAVAAFRLGAAEALEAGEALGFALALGVLAAALAFALARAFAATQAGILKIGHFQGRTVRFGWGHPYGERIRIL